MAARWVPTPTSCPGGPVVAIPGSGWVQPGHCVVRLPRAPVRERHRQRNARAPSPHRRDRPHGGVRRPAAVGLPVRAAGCGSCRGSFHCSCWPVERAWGVCAGGRVRGDVVGRVGFLCRPPSSCGTGGDGGGVRLGGGQGGRGGRGVRCFRRPWRGVWPLLGLCRSGTDETVARPGWSSGRWTVSRAGSLSPPRVPTVGAGAAAAEAAGGGGGWGTDGRRWSGRSPVRRVGR